MRRVTYSLFLTFLICTSVFCQDLKTYSGKYAVGFNQNGKATYTYYEDPTTSEYVKHGKFNYNIELNSNDEGNAKITILGTYKNGVRDGIWKYTTQTKDFKDHTKNNMFTTGTITLNAVYSKGKPNGKWSYILTNKNRSRIYSFTEYTWGDYSKTFNGKLNLEYKNGTLINSFKATDIGWKYDVIQGQFDINGHLIGEWIWKNSNKEIKATYEKGVEITSITRSLPDGKIITKTTTDEATTSIKQRFISGTLTQQEIAKERIFIDTLHPELALQYSNIIEDELFYKYIDGDITHYYQQGNHVEPYHNSRNEGIYMIIKKVEYKELSSISTYQDAEEYFEKHDYYNAIARYERTISNNDRNSQQSKFSPEDELIIIQRIEESEKLWEEQKRQKEMYVEIKKIDNFMQGRSNLFSYDLSELLYKSKLCKEILATYEDIIPENKEKYINESLNQIAETIEEKITFNLVRETLLSIWQNHKTISKYYENIVTRHERGTVKNNKVHVFYAYRDIYNFYNSQPVDDVFYDEEIRINKSKGLWQEKSIITSERDNIIKLQELNISLIDSDTKDLEKALRKAKEIDDKEIIFKNLLK